jgi:hypothetical protein
MCTVVVSVDPASPFPVLLVGVRDEFIARAWQHPGRHWPDRPDLIGGRDIQAGGTWLAMHPGVPRAACVLNGHGRMAAERIRISRGELPLRAAAADKPGDALAGLDLTRFDPFHLVYADPDAVWLWNWDGDELVERPLGAGLHIVVNSGLEARTPPRHRSRYADVPGSAEMSARVAYFRARFATVPRPEPYQPATARAWGQWLSLADGDGLDRTDPRALVLRRDLGDGRIWGTTSVSLLALTRAEGRMDFSAEPGDLRAWYTVTAPADVP